ncbi:Rv3235 family protein [Streptomyces sp. ME08-AFT2]|nr:Rv3235 family protein [Streptomyces sp. ME08-AFT2]MDX3310650.1 Rv3235 family protein [Streptomyces sp. ME08-AFT2]
MTRTQHHPGAHHPGAHHPGAHSPGAHHPGARPPGARPPGRRDTRRPGGAPPRTPDGGTPRTAPPRTPAGLHPAGPPTTRSPPPPPTHPAAGQPGNGRPAQNRPANGHPAAPATLPVPSSPTPLALAAVPVQTPRRPLAQPRPTDLFADRLLAVLTGRRPVHFMLRHTLGRAYDDLAHLAERGPLRTTHGVRAVVRDIGYYIPRPGAIEAFARIGAGDRLRAMAFRLELGTDRRWRCTAVELDGPRGPHTRHA